MGHSRFVANMKLSGIFLQLLLYCGIVLVKSQLDQCNYQISAKVSKQVTYVGVYFTQVTLFENEFLPVSYTWNGQHFTDLFSYVNSTTTSLSSYMQKCFPKGSLMGAFWSSESVTVMHIPSSSKSGDCQNVADRYTATYFTETCGDTLTLSLLSPPGTISFPTHLATFPCNVSCTWFIKAPRGSNISVILSTLYVGGFGFGELTITGLDHASNFKQCRLASAYSAPMWSDVYIGDFGNNVTIDFRSNQLVGGGSQLKIGYSLIGSNRSSCTYGNFTISRGNCNCSGQQTIPTQRVDSNLKGLRGSYIARSVRDTITNITATPIIKELFCRRCVNNSSVTTLSTLTTTVSNGQDKQDLSQLKENVTADNVGQMLSNLTIILDSITARLTPTNVTDAVDALSAAADIVGISPEAGKAFDASADLILTKGSNSFTPTTTHKFLNAIKSYGRNVNLTIGESSEFFNGSSFANVVTVVNCSAPQFPIGLLDRSTDKQGNSVGLVNSDSKDTNYLVNGMIGYIAIEPTVICINDSKSQSQKSEDTRVSFQLYRTPLIFATNDTQKTPSDRSSYCDKTFISLGDSVISATIIERSRNQTDPQMSVQIGFRRSKLSRNFLTDCAYWQNGNWEINSSTQLIHRNGEMLVFQANHLTDFALIMSSNAKERIFCEPALDILGTVGSSFSLIALILMSISLVVIRWVQQSAHSIVLLSLFFNGSFALFFLCFTLFSDQLTLKLSDSACSAFAAVMYYLLMSTMMWTCCRAALVYKRYVIVFDTGRFSTSFTFNRVTTVISTVVPFLIVLIVGLTDSNFFERTDFFCWINPTNAGYAVIIPISLMLIMSITVLIMVVRSVFFSAHPETSVYQSKVTKRKSLRRKIWVLFAIQISLGLPWIFLYMAEIPDTSVFHYLFTITNSFQGVWIAALHFYERRKDLGKLLRQLAKDSSTLTTTHSTPQ